MRKTLIAALLLIGYIFLSNTAYSQDEKVQNYKFLNKTGVTVVKLFAKPVNTTDWGENLMTIDMVSNGRAFMIGFPQNPANCSWDIKFRDQNDKDYFMNSVNICGAQTVTLIKDDHSENIVK